MTQSQGQSEFEIASLRVKTIKNVNLMTPGNGTPWEDRGSQGVVMAFLRTCWRSLFGHAHLLDHIRRPETTSEATKFAIGCAILWALSFGIWNTYRYIHFNNDPANWDLEGSQYLMESALQSLLVFVVVLVLLRIMVKMYLQLIAGETKGRVPDVLVHNAFAYSLGPSLLALVPVVGWVLAPIWIFVDLIIAGRRRLYLNKGGVVTNTILVVAVALAIIGALWLVIWIVWVHMEIPFAPSVQPHVNPPPRTN